VVEVDGNDKITSWRDYYDSRGITVDMSARSGAPAREPHRSAGMPLRRW